MKEHLVMCDDVLFSIAFFANAKHLCTTHNNYYYYRKEGNTATINSGYENTKKSGSGSENGSGPSAPGTGMRQGQTFPSCVLLGKDTRPVS